MQPIGTAFRTDYLPGDLEPSYDAAMLDRFVRLPATAVLETELEQAHRKTHIVKRNDGEHEFSLVPDEIDRRIRFAERRLRWGQARDAIQANRPDGCWCLGTGVRRAPGGGIVEFCPCGEGAMTAQQRAEQARRQDAATERWRRERAWELAGIPPRCVDYTIASYERVVARASGRVGVPLRIRDAIARVQRWAIADSPRSLLLFGDHSTGKTGLAVALLRCLVLEQGQRGFFASVPEVLDMLRPSRAEDHDERVGQAMTALRTVPVLIVDDIGAQKDSDWSDERLFIVLEHRKNNLLRTIVTSNLSPEELGERIGPRITWRITEDAEVVHLSGVNLREEALV